RDRSAEAHDLRDVGRGGHPALRGPALPAADERPQAAQGAQQWLALEHGRRGRAPAGDRPHHRLDSAGVPRRCRMKNRLDLTRELLDMQVVDQEETKMGKVDGIVLELRGDQPPRVDALEMGFVVLAQRVSPRVEGWLERLRRRFSVRKTARYRVPWSKVKDIQPHHVQID